MLGGMSETPSPAIWPALTYADASAAIRFLVEAFGFVETIVVPGDGGREIAHAELRWPEGGGVMLGSTCDDSVFGRLKPGTTSIYVVTDAPDKVFERATMAGAEVVRGLRDEDYGSRGFTVRDPEGTLWSFGTYRGA
ncbi:MAG: VOC family protein [Pseudonocardiaceae bacterium]